MSAVVMATFAKAESLVLGGQAINKSYPEFIKDYKKLGGIIDVDTKR